MSQVCATVKGDSFPDEQAGLKYQKKVPEEGTRRAHQKDALVATSLSMHSREFQYSGVNAQRALAPRRQPSAVALALQPPLPVWHLPPQPSSKAIPTVCVARVRSSRVCLYSLSRTSAHCHALVPDAHSCKKSKCPTSPAAPWPLPGRSSRPRAKLPHRKSYRTRPREMAQQPCS